MARGNSTVATGEVTVATGEIGHGRPRGACRNFCQSHVRQKQRHSNTDRDVRPGILEHGGSCPSAGARPRHFLLNCGHAQVSWPVYGN